MGVESFLTKKLEEMAGKNFFGTRSKQIEGLLRVVDYLITQYRIAAKNAKYDAKEVDAVLYNCIRFLEG